MVQAIRFFGPYLCPTPRDEELGCVFVNYQRYSIRQDKLWSFVDNIIQNSSVLSLEAMLLSVDCFGRTSTDTAFKCLLARKGKTDVRTGGGEILPVRTLFVMWLDFVLRMLDQSCRSNTAPGRGRMQGQQVPVDNSKRVEVMTANAIVGLISRFLTCLKSARQLEELKTEFSVDWLDLCSKTLIIAKRYNLEGLSKTCSVTLSQLDKVRRMEGDAPISLMSLLSAAPNKKAVPAAVADREAKVGALRFDGTWQNQAASANRDETPRCPPGGGAVAGAPAKTNVSASTLPELERPDWMLVGAKKFRQCKFFDGNNFCKFGAQCRYAHIYRPPLPLPDNAPSESLLHFIYTNERGCPLRPTDFHVVSKSGSDGRMWHTVALVCPKDGIIYHSAGGLGGRISAQGVYFYSTVREAMAAVAGIIISALRDIEAISNYYGPFESFVHHKQALDTAAMEPPKKITLPNTSLTRTHSAPPGTLMTRSQGNDEDDSSSLSSKGVSVGSIPQHPRASPVMVTPSDHPPPLLPTGNPLPPPRMGVTTGSPTQPLLHPPRQQKGFFSSMIPPAERVIQQGTDLAHKPFHCLPAEVAPGAGTSVGEKRKKTAENSVSQVVAKEKTNDYRTLAIEEKNPPAASVAVAKWTGLGHKTESKTVSKSSGDKSYLRLPVHIDEESRSATKGARIAKSTTKAEISTMTKANEKSEVMTTADATTDDVAAGADAKAIDERDSSKETEAAKEKSVPKTKTSSAKTPKSQCLSNQPPAIERKQIKSRQSVFCQLPRCRMKYLQQKSRHEPSSGIPISSTSGAGENSSEKGHMEIIPYWDTLGSCRLDSNVFQWANANQNSSSSPAPIGYDKKLGRVYYSSFTLHGKHFNVGDFIVRTEYGSDEAIRIVGAFQATKSFLGRWGGGIGWENQEKSEEIQKRGHPYLLLAPMVAKSTLCKGKGGRKRKKEGPEEELVLHTEFDTNVCPLPQWLGEAGEYRKISVRVLFSTGDNSEIETIVGDRTSFSAKSAKKCPGKKRGAKSLGETFVCKAALVPSKETSQSPELTFLNSQQYALLTAPQDVLLSSHVPVSWDSRFRAYQVQMVHSERDVDRDQYEGGTKVKFQYTGASSDDSDGFADEDGDESDSEGSW